MVYYRHFYFKSKPDPEWSRHATGVGEGELSRKYDIISSAEGGSVKVRAQIAHVAV